MFSRTGSDPRNLYPPLTDKINNFLNTTLGRQFVNGLDDITFTGTTGANSIIGQLPYAQQLLSLGSISGWSADETRIALAGAIDLFNRSPNGEGKKVLTELSKPGMTLDKFQAYVNGLSGDLGREASKAMMSAGVINRLLTSGNFVGVALQEIDDVTLRGNNSFAGQIIDAMVRDPSGAGKFLDYLDGSTTKPVVLLSGTQGSRPGSVYDVVPHIGIDKDGYIFVQQLGTTTRINSSDPTQFEIFPTNNEKPVIRFKNGAWRISLAEGYDAVLADGTDTFINIGGYNVPLSTNPYEVIMILYAFR